MTVAFAAPVVASHVVVRTSFPSTGTVGQIVALAIDLRTPEGAPLSGTTVTYYLHMSFGGVEGQAEIGRAVADDSGVATIQYQPRAAGLHEVRMEYLAPGATTAEEVVATFDVAGGTQLVRSAGGADIPGINSGLLMVVLGTVWLILLSVAFRLVAIARAGGASEPARGDGPP
jgi:hypothetical protein